MNQPKVGVRLESLGLSLRKAIVAAARMGAQGVQVDASGDLDPKNLSETGRREFRNLLKTYNLELSAIGCPLARGLDVSEGQEGRIDRIKLSLVLGFDLGPRIVIVEAGAIPADEKDPGFALLSEAMLALGQHGDRVGATTAMETGLESGERLRQFLDRFDTGSLAVNFDPANLMMHGFSVESGLHALRERIVHVHAKDARASGASRTAQEVPLGHGDIDWLGILAGLEQFAYRGYLTVERDGGNDRLAEVAGGVKFLRRLVG